MLNNIFSALFTARQKQEPVPVHKNNRLLVLMLVVLLHSSCEKLVSIDAPIDTITTTEVFNSNEQATAAMASVYSNMINDKNGSGNAIASFSTGLATILGALSADELDLFVSQGDPFYLYNTNRLVAEDNYSTLLWTSAYNTIYGANAVIEGIAASASGKLHESVRKQLTGEAKFIRAFSYFYLTNFYGDVPLVLTVDFNATRNLVRTPKKDVYKQIIQDLQDALAVLPTDFSAGNGERTIPNKWAAAALLARTYLYNGEYARAAEQATAVIDNAAQYKLENASDVFLKESKEAIWQLKQNTSIYQIGNATPEGIFLIPDPLPGINNFYYLRYQLSGQLLNAFEPGDLRRANWVGSSVNPVNATGTYYFPFKYKTGNYNKVPGGVASEYYVCLRLAEQYLIRAEAVANGAGGDAIADLNLVRERADLPPLPASLSGPGLLAAIAHERQTELFAEWGHRWFDLKRTGKASNVLSQNPVKQPWQGDYQLLYPIPPVEIKADHYLVQNPQY